MTRPLNILPTMAVGSNGLAGRRLSPQEIGLVSLVRPSRISSKGCMTAPFTPPLGLAYLAAILREEGIEVLAIDGTAEAEDRFTEEGDFYYQGLTPEETADRIDARTRVVGVSCMFSQDWPFVRRLIEAVRKRFPEALIVAGGEHVSALADESLRMCRALDVCVMGEGEDTFLELVTTARDPAAWRQIAGLAFLDGEEFVRTKARARIREVDEIPWPAWDLFPMEVYLSTDNMYGVNRGRTIGILATRGCPYQCTFCSNPSMYGKAWEARDPSDLLDEIEHYVRVYRVENVDFYDLTMVLKREWILEFVREMERRDLKFTWQLPSGTRSEIIDDEVAAALYRSGCRNLAFAPESGSLDTLHRIKKRVDLDRMTRAAKSAMRHGIRVKLNIIIGFPHETRRHLWDTMLFCWKMAVIGVDAAETMVFSPYPGTELFDELRRDGTIGKLDDDYFLGLGAFLDLTKPSHYCRHVNGYELAVWRVFNMFSFFIISFSLRPWRVVRLFWNVLRNRSVTVLEHRLGVVLNRKKKGVWRRGTAPAELAIVESTGTA